MVRAEHLGETDRQAPLDDQAALGDHLAVNAYAARSGLQVRAWPDRTVAPDPSTTLMPCRPSDSLLTTGPKREPPNRRVDESGCDRGDPPDPNLALQLDEKATEGKHPVHDGLVEAGRRCRLGAPVDVVEVPGRACVLEHALLRDVPVAALADQRGGRHPHLESSYRLV